MEGLSMKRKIHGMSMCLLLSLPLSVHAESHNCSIGYATTVSLSVDGQRSGPDSTECVTDGRILDWDCLEQELLELLPLELVDRPTVIDIQSGLLPSSDSLRQVLDKADISQHLQMVGQHSSGRVLIPMVGAAALKETDSDLYYYSVLKLLIEFSASECDVQRALSSILVESLREIWGTDKCVEMLITYLQSRHSELIAWELFSAILQLRIGSNLSDWMQEQECFGISVDYLSQIVLMVWEWRSQNDRQRLDDLRGVLGTFDRLPGVPRFVYALISDDSEERIAAAISDTILYLDTHRERIPDVSSHILVLLGDRQMKIMNEYIDLEGLDISEQTRAELVEWREIGDR